MRNALPSLLLFARAPEPGRVKTRLAPFLTEQGAARLYRAFLEDASRLYLDPSWSSVLAADPDPEEAFLASLFLCPPWRREAQGAGDLGERLARAFERELQRGCPAVAAVGSDHPTLPRRLLREAFDRVRGGEDATLVPAEDGGYCLIALSPRASPREVFRQVPWSGDRVLEVTLERIRASGLRFAVLEAAYDVDRPEDIGRLRRELASRDPAEEDFPRATARALEALPTQG